MMNHKKSQGMSMNVIIAAALALVVLVVLLAIFTGSIGKTSQNIGSCTTKGGECASKFGNVCKGEFPIPIFVSGGCPDSKPKDLCCISAGMGEGKRI